MSVTTRTNRITNPESNGSSTTGWTGTGTTIAATAGTITGLSQQYFRATLTNVTAGAYTQRADMLTPVGSAVAGVTYQFSVWVRNIAGPRTVSVVGYFTDSAGSAITTISVGSEVGASWTLLSATGVAPAGVNRMLLRIGVNNDQSNWAVGDFFDFGAAYVGESGDYFDGSFTNGAGVVYAWTGTANASTSTATAYVPTVTVVGKTDAPCPRVEVTIQDLGTGSTVYNIWRTADNVRKIVRGARNKSTVGSDFLIDHEPSLGRTLTYDVEIVSGLATTAPTNPGTVTVTSTTWWIQDPLVPSSAIALQTVKGNNALPDLTAAAVKDLEYAADVTIIPILGSSEPVALMSGRRLAGNVDFSMFTRAAEATTALRNLIQQTPLLLIRPNGVTNNGVPGLAYFASAKPVEQPVNVDIGGTITRWQLTGDLVAAPSLDVLVPIWTYGDVDNLWTTYQQGQTTLASKTYLDVLKSPSGV